MTGNTNLKIEKKKSHLWITFPSTINRENILQIQNRIEDSLKGKHKRVALDLKGIDAAGSIVINLIMDVRQAITKQKGTLSLVNLSKDCIKLFRSMNLDKVLAIYDDEREINSNG